MDIKRIGIAGGALPSAGNTGGEGGNVNVIDSLTSSSKVSALSANQGRVLDGKVKDIEASKADKTEVEKIEKKVEALMSLHELEELAFSIDINSASAKGSTRVDVGGNLMMRSMWENSKKPILMDRDGNYIELNPNDCRYTAEGEYLLKEDGTIIDKYSHCDMMELIPEYYGYVQTVTVGETTKLLPWFSLVPLPGGYIIPQQVVAKFKSGNVSSQMRSLPGLVPDNTKTVNAFWNLAQKRSANHGLANLDFRNYLLFHLMSKYGYRDVQNAVGGDGTKVFGVGLDGTESKGSDKFTDQRHIKTGSTLTLGDNDGNVAVTDNNGDTVHSVSVCGFENPYGPYWEMVQGLCSVGTDVYHWRGNVMPTGTPTAETFAKIDHTLLMRPTTAVWGMNIIASEEGQGVYMIPKESVSGISYGDYFSYSETGQLWLFGGSSRSGANCGLASAGSYDAWSASLASLSARLAYYGSVRKVSSAELSNE